MWRDKVALKEGEKLRYESSRTKGFMSEEDITEYVVLDADDKVIGKVVHTDHTAVNGFRRNQTVRQVDLEGRILVDERWTGD